MPYPYWRLTHTCEHRWCVNPAHLKQTRVREAEPVVFSLALLETLEPHLELDPVGGCWFWTGDLNGIGYAVAYIGSGLRSVDVVLFDGLVGFGPDQSPVSHQLFHRCKHRSCVNPLHMNIVPFGARRVLEKTPEVAATAAQGDDEVTHFRYLNPNVTLCGRAADGSLLSTVEVTTITEPVPDACPACQSAYERQQYCKGRHVWP
jgi:hypothetical protein